MHTTTTTLAAKPGLVSIAQRALQTLSATLSAAYGAWTQQRQAHATADALALLDERTLRDLALDRSELFSAAAELHGRVDRERRHAWLTPR